MKNRLLELIMLGNGFDKKRITFVQRLISIGITADAVSEALKKSGNVFAKNWEDNMIFELMKSKFTFDFLNLKILV